MSVSTRRRPAAAAPPPGLAIVYRALTDLSPYARNARTHKPAQIAKLKVSLLQYGWTNPLLIAETPKGATLIAGHGRLIAALELRDEGKCPPLTPSIDQAPTVDLSHLSPTQRRGYVLADNRLAIEAGWNRELLASEFKGLELDGFDILFTGFTKDEVKRANGTRWNANSGLGPGMAYQVVVDANDEQHQAALLKRFKAEGLKCKPIIL